MINDGVGSGFCLNEINISFVLFSLSFILFLSDQALTLSTAFYNRLTFEQEMLSDVVTWSIYLCVSMPSCSSMSFIQTIKHNGPSLDP